MGFPENLKLRLMDCRKIQASKLDAIAPLDKRQALHKSVHAHNAEVVESNYLIERHRAFTEGTELLHKDDLEVKNPETIEPALTDEEFGIARRNQLQRLQESEAEKLRSKVGTNVRRFIPSEIKNYLLKKVLTLNDLTYTKVMLTKIPVNTGGRGRAAEWDNFILSVIANDPKLKSMVIGFLPKCISLKQLTQKLRESLLKANPHGIFFVAEKQAGKRGAAEKPLKGIAARCESSSSDDDSEIIPATPDKRVKLLR